MAAGNMLNAFIVTSTNKTPSFLHPLKIRATSLGRAEQRKWGHHRSASKQMADTHTHSGESVAATFAATTNVNGLSVCVRVSAQVFPFLFLFFICALPHFKPG